MRSAAGSTSQKTRSSSRWARWRTVPAGVSYTPRDLMPTRRFSTRSDWPTACSLPSALSVVSSSTGGSPFPFTATGVLYAQSEPYTVHDTRPVITEIPLRASPSQESILLKRLEAARRVYNACLGEALQRAQSMRRSPAYQAARRMPKGAARTEAFRQARQAAEFGEYALHTYAKQFGHSCLGDHLDSLVVQTVATRAYHAAKEYILGKKGKPRFKGKNQFDSVEGKANTSGLRWKDNQVVWNIRSGKALTLVPLLPAKDKVIQHGLSSRVKYVRIVRRKLNGRNRFYVQLVGEGRPFQKPENKVGKGEVGLDIGPQTIKITRDYVDERLHELVVDEDLANYIL